MYIMIFTKAQNFGLIDTLQTFTELLKKYIRCSTYTRAYSKKNLRMPNRSEHLRMRYFDH